jgi:hypothetical protein
MEIGAFAEPKMPSCTHSPLGAQSSRDTVGRPEPLLHLGAHVRFSPKEPFHPLPHSHLSKQPHPFLEEVPRHLLSQSRNHSACLNPVYFRRVSVLITRLLPKILHPNGAPQHTPAQWRRIWFLTRNPIFFSISLFCPGIDRRVLSVNRTFPSNFAIASLFVAFIDFERWGNPSITHSATIF